MTTKSNKALPENIASMLAAADKRNGFPSGTMQSVMQQEVGGNFEKYLKDPGTYHYGKNAEGKRVAGHTGKVSTAFGPFGILESTGADPGYGVSPLKDKSIEEQVRFAGDYLAARSKQAGGLQAGLSGYGEGSKYGQQVAARIGKGAGPAPTQMALASGPKVAEVTAPEPMRIPSQQEIMASATPQEAQMLGTQVQGSDPWMTFQQQMAAQAPVQSDDLAYGVPGMLSPNAVRSPDFGSMASYAQPRDIDFSAFKGRV